jgi:hypothetical protein
MSMNDNLHDHFSVNAADLVRLRRALYGADDAKTLMMNCFKVRPNSTRVNETTVLNQWQLMDDTACAALPADELTSEYMRRCAERGAKENK